MDGPREDWESRLTLVTESVQGSQPMVVMASGQVSRVAAWAGPELPPAAAFIHRGPVPGGEAATLCGRKSHSLDGAMALVPSGHVAHGLGMWPSGLQRSLEGW